MDRKETADKVKKGFNDSVRQLLDTTNQLVEVGKEIVHDLSVQFLAEINGLKPILTECGFAIQDLNVTFPLPAEFRMTIEQTGLGKKTLEQILEENKDDKPVAGSKLSNMQKTIISSMIKANDLADITSRYGYTFKTYDVTLSTPPKVTIHLISNKPTN